MDPRLLTEVGWKTLVVKFKLKDSALQKALAAFEKLPEEKHADRLKAAAQVAKLAGDLKKAKEITALGDVVKYLTNVAAAGQSALKEITVAKGLAEKSAAAAKVAAAKVQQKEESGEDEEDETGDSFVRLKKLFQSLRLAKMPYWCIICDAKPYGLVISKKNIYNSMQHKKELCVMAGGSTRPPKKAMCLMDGSTLVFEMEKPPTGLAGILQKWLKVNIGFTCKVKVGAETAEDEAAAPGGKLEVGGPEDALEKEADAVAEKVMEMKAPAEPPVPPEEIAKSKAPAGGGLILGASVGRGGKNNPADVEMVQESLNRRIKAGLTISGKLDAKTLKAIENFQKALGQLKPDGMILPGRGTSRALAENGKLPPPPPPPKPIAPPKLGKPTLAKAPLVWRSTRGILETNINELKKGVRAQYGSEHPELLAQIEEGMTKLGSVLDNLDDSLAGALDKANGAADKSAKSAEVKSAKAILSKYIGYVKNEPMINHMDKNPFGVKTSLKEIITDSLSHLAKAMN